LQKPSVLVSKGNKKKVYHVARGVEAEYGELVVGLIALSPWPALAAGWLGERGEGVER